MLLRKWNFKTHEYEPYEIPDDMVCPMICSDMQTTINCASCLQYMQFGNGYTSRKIHTKTGFGYSVCEDCYNKEMEEENANRK